MTVNTALQGASQGCRLESERDGSGDSVDQKGRPEVRRHGKVFEAGRWAQGPSGNEPRRQYPFDQAWNPGVRWLE